MDFIIEKLSNIFLHRALILPPFLISKTSVIYLIYIFADIRPPLLADKLSDLHFRSYILSTDRNSIENGITYFSGRPGAPAFLASPKKKQLNPTFTAYLLLRETNREGRDRNDIGTTGGSGENGLQAITTPEYFNDEMLVEG